VILAKQITIAVDPLEMTLALLTGEASVRHDLVEVLH
jgi:hypothetical protein